MFGIFPVACILCVLSNDSNTVVQCLLYVKARLPVSYFLFEHQHFQSPVMDTALVLQDIVKTLKFDQSLEETVKFLDSISERDLTFFENNDFTEDSYLGEERVSGEVVGVSSHVQQGVICFNVDKMMRTTQVTKDMETSRSQHMDTSPSSESQDSMIQEEIFSESKSEFQESVLLYLAKLSLFILQQLAAVQRSLDSIQLFC